MQWRKSPLCCLSLVLFTTWLCPVAMAQYAIGSTQARRSYVPNQYIVRAARGASVDLVQQAVAKMGATLVRPVAISDTYLIEVGSSPSRMAYRHSGFAAKATKWVIESIQPNFMYYPCAVPNDDDWEMQWNMRLINAPAAWDIQKGSSSVVVAVTDTGVADHPELTARLVQGIDTVDDDEDPSNDLVGHGTHCAGVIAAQGDNGIGVCGVAWNGVKIMPIRVLGVDGGTTDSFVNGLDYALDKGVDVVSMSMGGYFDDPSVRLKVQDLAADSIILVASAGNDYGEDTGYPAAYPEVISVSAVGPDDSIAPYSSVGKVEIAAPGGDVTQGIDAMVWSTYVIWSGTTPTMGYTYMEGTSMACPHVSGAAALLRSMGVGPEEVRNRLMVNARPPKTGTLNATEYGAGILDLRAALANAVVKITKPGKGATIGTSPDFRIQIQGVNTATLKVYLDYADLNDDGIPDNPSEGVIIDGTTVNLYLNTARTEIGFSWSEISSQSAMTAGAHNLYVSADAMAGGGTASDWEVFTVAKTKISKGIHLFAFPYAFTNRTTNTPSGVLPGAKFGLAYNPRSVLWRYIAAPDPALTNSPVGYVLYTPSSTADRVWSNPWETMSGSSIPTGGGYYYQVPTPGASTGQATFAYPAGAGFWLVLPGDVWVDETYTPLESLSDFDGSKGFSIPLYKGYNLIGNPYAHSVPWRAALFTYRGQTKTLLDAESAGWVKSNIFGYSGSEYVRVTDRDMFEPYSGYWLYALIGGVSESDTLTLNVLP